MHDRKLTECVNDSGLGSPETPLKGTADAEQRSAAHESGADADTVSDAGPSASLPFTYDNPEPARGGEPEHFADADAADSAEPLQPTIAPVLDASLEAETAALTGSTDDKEAESAAPPLSPGDDSVTVEPEAQQPLPTDIAPATQEPAPGAGDPELRIDPPVEPAASGLAGSAPAHPPEAHGEAPQSVDEPAPDQGWTELPSEASRESGADANERSEPPPAGARADLPSQAAPADWNDNDLAAASQHTSDPVVPVSAPPQTLPAAPTPSIEVGQGRTVETDALSERKIQSPFRLIAAAFRYSAIAFCGWLAAMVLLIAIFRFVNPPTSALMLIRSAQGIEIDQRWVPLGEISPNLIRAVIASEDGRFCSHWGIDPREVLDAIRDANGGTPRGASTMTMQLAKNLFLWPQQSYIRKALEVPLTLAIDAMWPKSRIAEVYLNVVEWGPGIFGAEAAARRHFDTSAAKLSQRRSALLAVTLPNPNVRKPATPSRMHNRMASTIVARMRSMPTADDCVSEAR